MPLRQKLLVDGRTGVGILGCRRGHGPTWVVLTVH